MRRGWMLVMAFGLGVGCNGDERPADADEPRPAPAVVIEDTAEAVHSVIERDGIGPLRLGMTAEEVGGLPGARDTVWLGDEGMEERGVVAPVNGVEVLALVVAERVDRIHLRDPAPRTPEGLGVASTLGELRAAYGSATAGEGHGRLVVWFDAFPGVSFQVEVPPAEEVYRLARDPTAIPDTVRVTELWVR